MPDQNPTGGQDPAAPTGVQSPNGDQGTGGGEAQPTGGGGGFNWELFPDIPEAQRPLLEPHLKQVQGHVTQLEQRYAPFKTLVEGGADPEAVQSLISFDQQFSQDPVGTWLTLAENMQKEGALSNDLDLEAVKAILNGEDPPEEGGEGEGSPEEEDMPQWARQLQRENQELREREETRTQQSQAQQRQQQLEETTTNIKAQLKEAGFPEEGIDDDLIIGAIIAHKGDPDKALSSLTGLREKVLGGLRANGSKESDDVDSGPKMPKGAPKAPTRESRGAGKEFADARQGAKQMLEQRLRAEAQQS